MAVASRGDSVLSSHGLPQIAARATQHLLSGSPCDAPPTWRPAAGRGSPPPGDQRTSCYPTCNLLAEWGTVDPAVARQLPALGNAFCLCSPSACSCCSARGGRALFVELLDVFVHGIRK